MTIQAMQDEPTTDQPFEALDDVGSANEQIKAGLETISDNIHQFFDGHRGQLTPGQQKFLYDQWLMLELVRRSFDANVELFHRAENALYAARVPQQFSHGREKEQ